MKKGLLILLLFASMFLVGCANNDSKDNEENKIGEINEKVELDNGEYVGRLLQPELEFDYNLDIVVSNEIFEISPNDKYSYKEEVVDSDLFSDIYSTEELGYKKIKTLSFEKNTEDGQIKYHLFNHNGLILRRESHYNDNVLITYHKLFKKEFNKPADYDLEYWIGDFISISELSKHTIVQIHTYDGPEFLDKNHPIVDDKYVSYLIHYPESSPEMIMKIIITDPSVSIYGVNLNSNPEDFEEAFEKMGFKFSYGVGSLGKYRITKPSFDDRSIIIWISETN